MSKRKHELPDELFREVATGGRAATVQSTSPLHKPTLDEFKAAKAHAKGIVDAIVSGVEDGEWGALDGLCEDADGKARRFTTLEILRLVEEVAGAASRVGKRADALRSFKARKSVKARHDKLVPLREFVVRMYEARKWKTYADAARTLCKPVLAKRDELGLSTPIYDNAENWIVDVLGKHYKAPEAARK